MRERGGSSEDLVLMSDLIHGDDIAGLYLNHDHRERKDVCFFADGRVSTQDLRRGEPYGGSLSE